MRRWGVLGCLFVGLIEFDCRASAQESWTPTTPPPSLARPVDAAGTPSRGAVLPAPLGNSVANSGRPANANPPAEQHESTAPHEPSVEIGSSAPGEDHSGLADIEAVEPPATLASPSQSRGAAVPLSPSSGPPGLAESDVSSVPATPRDVQGSATAFGPTIGTAPMRAVADDDSVSRVAGRGAGETPNRLVAVDLQSRQRQPLTGRPLPLVDLLSIAPDRRAQLELVAAYWRLVEALCVYHTCLDYDATVSELAASATRPEDAGVWRGATAAAAAVVREAEVTLASAQCDAALLAGLDPSEAAPLPVDPPYAGAYQTRFNELFATAPAPAQVRLLAMTLPLLVEAIDARAAAVRAAGEVVAQETARYRRGDVAPDAVLAALNRHLRQRQSFHAAVGRFNRQIAEYVLGVTPEGTRPEALLSMMIVPARPSQVVGDGLPPVGAAPASGPTSDPARGARAVPASGELRPVAALEPIGAWTPGAGATGGAIAPSGPGVSGTGVPGAVVPGWSIPGASAPATVVPGIADRPTLAPRRIPQAVEAESRPIGSSKQAPAATPERQVPTRAVRPGSATQPPVDERQVPTRAIRPATSSPAATPTSRTGGAPVDSPSQHSIPPAVGLPIDVDDGDLRRLVPIPDDSAASDEAVADPTSRDEAAVEAPPRGVPYRVNKPPVDESQHALAPTNSPEAALPILLRRDLSAAPVAGWAGVAVVDAVQRPSENLAADAPSGVGVPIRTLGAEVEVPLTSPALFAGLLQATPVSQAKQVAAALCAAPGASAEKSDALDLTDCLRAAPSSARAEAVEAYWNTTRWASKCQVVDEQANWLDELALAAGRSVAEGGHVARDGLPAQWRSARGAAEAERLEARASLVEAQFALAGLTGRGQADRLPMPTTVPCAGRYDPKLGALAPQLSRSWVLRRLAAAIGAFGGAVLGHATAVVEADLRRAELAAAFARGDGSIEPAIVAVERQAAASSAFLDALAGYNQAIGRYVLSVAPAGAPIEVVRGAMVAEP